MGIIGGQDGPTAVFVATGSPMGVIVLAVAAVLIVSVGIWVFRHRNGK